MGGGLIQLMSRRISKNAPAAKADARRTDYCLTAIRYTQYSKSPSKRKIRALQAKSSGVVAPAWNESDDQIRALDYPNNPVGDAANAVIVRVSKRFNRSILITV